MALYNIDLDPETEERIRQQRRARQRTSENPSEMITRRNLAMDVRGAPNYQPDVALPRTALGNEIEAGVSANIDPHIEKGKAAVDRFVEDYERRMDKKLEADRKVGTAAEQVAIQKAAEAEGQRRARSAVTASDITLDDVVATEDQLRAENRTVSKASELADKGLIRVPSASPMAAGQARAKRARQGNVEFVEGTGPGALMPTKEEVAEQMAVNEAVDDMSDEQLYTAIAMALIHGGAAMMTGEMKAVGTGIATGLEAYQNRQDSVRKRQERRRDWERKIRFEDQQMKNEAIRHERDLAMQQRSFELDAERHAMDLARMEAQERRAEQQHQRSMASGMAAARGVGVDKNVSQFITLVERLRDSGSQDPMREAFKLTRWSKGQFAERQEKSASPLDRLIEDAMAEDGNGQKDIDETARRTLNQ